MLFFINITCKRKNAFVAVLFKQRENELIGLQPN